MMGADVSNMCKFLSPFVLILFGMLQIGTITHYLLGPKTGKNMYDFFFDPSAKPSYEFQSFPADSTGADMIDDALEYDIESEAPRQITSRVTEMKL